MYLIVIIIPDANIKFKVSGIPTCQYKNEGYDDFTCDEPTIDTESKFCIFHNVNYLKATHDSLHHYHKEQVVKRLKMKLSEYSSNHKPLKFIGYYLPDISFQSEQFTEVLYYSKNLFVTTSLLAAALCKRDLLTHLSLQL